MPVGRLGVALPPRLLGQQQPEVVGRIGMTGRHAPTEEFLGLRLPPRLPREQGAEVVVRIGAPPLHAPAEEFLGFASRPGRRASRLPRLFAASAFPAAIAAR